MTAPRLRRPHAAPLTALRRTIVPHLPTVPVPPSLAAIPTTAQSAWAVVEGAHLNPVLVGVVGSHLHGCAGPESDLDLFAVGTDDSPGMGAGSGTGLSAAHIITDGVDLRVSSLSAFLDETARGGHQPVELLMSRHTAVAPAYRPLFASIRVNPYLFERAAQDALEVAADRGEAVPAHKLERMTTRLLWEVDQMHNQGRFDPSRSPVCTWT